MRVHNYFLENKCAICTICLGNFGIQMTKCWKNEKMQKKIKKLLTTTFKCCIIDRLASCERLIIENWTTWRKKSTIVQILSKHLSKELKSNKKLDKIALKKVLSPKGFKIEFFREFDPGSGLTLAACITHSSRTVTGASVPWSVADGWVTREQSTSWWGITTGNSC